MNNRLEVLLKEWKLVPVANRRVLADKYYTAPWGRLNLSKENDALPDWKLEDVKHCSDIVFSALARAKTLVAYGGYGEVRACYEQSELFRSEAGTRSVHLGVDLWAQAGTEVLCPWPAKVHSYQDNNNFLDYGPTIILEHLTEGLSWYSLYGHLSRKSLDDIRVGQKFRAGDKLASIGSEDENGTWVPHLHFQLILDLEGHFGDYPGVCTEAQKDFYLSLCPNPDWLLAPCLQDEILVL